MDASVTHTCGPDLQFRLAAVPSELDSHLVVWDASAEDMELAAWFIDSTAPRHMTGNPSLLTDLIHVSNTFVDAGIGKGMQVGGIGSVNKEAVVLPDVWFVPGLGLSMNLVSVDQLTADPNLIIAIAGTGCNVTKMSDGSLVGSAHLRPDNKYEVDFLRIQQN